MLFNHGAPWLCAAILAKVCVLIADPCAPERERPWEEVTCSDLVIDFAELSGVSENSIYTTGELHVSERPTTLDCPAQSCGLTVEASLLKSVDPSTYAIRFQLASPGAAAGVCCDVAVARQCISPR